MTNAVDQELILQLKQGSLDALGVLFDRYRQMVFRTGLAITGDQEAADDLLQDVFLRLFRFADRIDPDRPFGTLVIPDDGKPGLYLGET
jgi:RNA polymerase sigma-70 factor (ECF subfamily)